METTKQKSLGLSPFYMDKILNQLKENQNKKIAGLEGFANFTFAMDYKEDVGNLELKCFENKYFILVNKISIQTKNGIKDKKQIYLFTEDGWSYLTSIDATRDVSIDDIRPYLLHYKECNLQNVFERLHQKNLI
jgi:hypothetical protein